MIVRELVTRLGFNADERKVRSYDRALNTVRNTALQLIGTFAAAFGVNELRRMADEAQSLRARLGQLPQTIGDSGEAFDEVFKHAQNARQSLSAYANFYIRAGHATQDYLKGQEDVMRIADSVAFALAAGGATAQEQSQAFFQLGQAIASPAVQMEEMNTVIDAAPQLFRALQDAIPEAGDSLKEFVGTGNLTGQMLAEALLKVLPQFRKQFNEMPLTIAQAGVKIRNRITQIVDHLNRETRFVEKIAHGMIALFEDLVEVIRTVGRWVNWLAEQIGGWGNVLRVARAALMLLMGRTVIRQIFRLRNAIRAAGGAVAFFGKALLRIPVFAFIAMLGLMLDDLYAWVNGNKSATGEVLGTWENFKKNLGLIWDDLHNDPAQFLTVMKLMLEDAGWALFDSTVQWMGYLGDFNRWFAGLFVGMGVDAGEALRKGIIDGFERLRTKVRELWSKLIDWMVDQMPEWMVDTWRSGNRLFGEAASAASSVSDRLFGDGSRPSVDAANGGGRSLNQRVEANISLEVPAGTSDDQMRYLERAADGIFRRLWFREMDFAAGQFAGE